MNLRKSARKQHQAGPFVALRLELALFLRRYRTRIIDNGIALNADITLRQIILGQAPSLPPGPTGLQPLPDMLVRLSAPPGLTTAEPFAPGALYEIQFDTNGDAVADLNYSVQVSSSEDGRQTATVRRIHGARAAAFSEEGEEIVKDAPVSVGGRRW